MQQTHDMQRTREGREEASPGRLGTTSCGVRVVMLLSESSSQGLGKGGTSIMRFHPLITALIGARQDYLLSANPR
jgi:hypothetical protein